MLYLLEKFDLDHISAEKNGHQYVNFSFWECPRARVASWLRYERSKSTLTKKQIVQIFEIDYPIQMVQVDDVTLKQFDKVIVWTPEDKYFVFEVTDFTS